MGTLPTYRWRFAPDGYATRRQLRALGLRPGGQDVAAELQRPRRRRGPLVAYLYRIDQAKPVRPMPPRPLGGTGKGEHRPPPLPRVRQGRGLRHPRLTRHLRALRLPRGPRLAHPSGGLKEYPTMSNADIRRLDRKIRAAVKKLEAVRRGEWWPLNGSERRAMARAVAGGSYRIVRGRDAGHAEERLESTAGSAEMRLNAELTALHAERQRLIAEAARAKAARKSSGWF